MSSVCLILKFKLNKIKYRQHIHVVTVILDGNALEFKDEEDITLTFLGFIAEEFSRLVSLLTYR